MSETTPNTDDSTGHTQEAGARDRMLAGELYDPFDPELAPVGQPRPAGLFD